MLQSYIRNGEIGGNVYELKKGISFYLGTVVKRIKLYNELIANVI